MEVSARPATTTDLEELVDLARIAVEEKDGTRGGDVWRRTAARVEPVRASLAADIDDVDAAVIVGLIDGVPVGYGVIRSEKLIDGTQLATISELFTLDGARGVSVGEVVMDQLIAWARGRECFGVDALALPGDRATKNFFETFGLVARAIVVHRRLDES